MERYSYTLDDYKNGVLEAAKKISTMNAIEISRVLDESAEVINMMDFIEQVPMNYMQVAWQTPIKKAYMRQYFGEDMRGGRFSDRLAGEFSDCTMSFSIPVDDFSKLEDVFKWCDNRNPDVCLTIGIFIMAANIYAGLKDQIAYTGPITITYISTENNDPNGYVTEQSIVRVRIIRFEGLNEMTTWLESYSKRFGLQIDFSKPGPIKILN